MAIWKERRVELALEQQRLAASVMQVRGFGFEEGRYELFPIPQQEIDLSAWVLEQNSNE